MITQKTLNSLNDTVKIEEIISQFVHLTKKGANFWACCPFHNENTPSFAISPEKGLYKCFGCGVAGDAISFLRELEGYTFIDAVKFLANKYNIDIEEAYPSPDLNRDQAESIHLLLSRAKDFYITTLASEDESARIALKYLHARQISDQAIQTYQIGYSPYNSNLLYEEIKNTQYSRQVLDQAALFIDKAGTIYDRFRGRIIFPIHNHFGKVIAFGGRILGENRDQPKYINSPESTVFHKRSSLYGIFQAKSEIKKNDCCYLVEGYTDAIALYDCGIKNVVASMGTSVTPEQISIIQRYTKNITIIFDGDPAGVKASLRHIDNILAQDMHVKVVPLPDTEDPHSLSIKLQPAAFKQFIQGSEQDFVEFKAKVLLSQAGDDTVSKVEAIREILQSLTMVKDTLKRLLLTKKCSNILGIDEKSLLTEQEKLLSLRKSKLTPLKHPPLQKPIDKYENKPEKIVENQEKEVIRILLQHRNSHFDNECLVYEYLIKELEDIKFSTPECLYIWSEFNKSVQDKTDFDPSRLLYSEDEDIRRFIIGLLSPRQEPSPNWGDTPQVQTNPEIENISDTVYKAILRLKLSIVRKLILENLNLLQQTDDPDLQDQILTKNDTLKHTEKSITDLLGIVVW